MKPKTKRVPLTDDQIAKILSDAPTPADGDVEAWLISRKPELQACQEPKVPPPEEPPTETFQFNLKL